MNDENTLLGIPVKYGFLAFALLIMAVPVYMIVSEEMNLRKGTAYSFLVEPVDPVDPFRGRYVDLRFSVERMDVDSASDRFNTGDWVYAPVAEGDDGYATFTELLHDAPPEGDYIPVRIQRVSDGSVFLELPFDRYYMKEDKAKRANRVIRRRAGSNDSPVWAKVFVRDGESTLDRVYVGDTPIETYLSEQK